MVQLCLGIWLVAAVIGSLILWTTFYVSNRSSEELDEQPGRLLPVNPAADRAGL